MPLRALRLAALSAMNFWIIIPQLPMDMSTRSASTALATRLAWAIIEKKLNSMWFSVTVRDQSRLRGLCAAARACQGRSVFVPARPQNNAGQRTQKNVHRKGAEPPGPRQGFEAENATSSLFFQDFF
ncbi:exported hypothetical protein [uncultured Desulfovibrio sp.]|uniref:Uncharacterized protein n=1 Tax=uncultured Desulfovibrio sp. TaxID=167968 RepID=A0A212JG84_9BACT|nr:exported hypothetical protein [uncultured Desulfovibrio sp.]